METIAPYLERPEFLAVIGPRQAGKTTLLEMLRNHLVEKHGIPFEMTGFVTFENRKHLVQFESDPVSFVRSFVPGERTGTFYLMIDEFQYAENGGQKLKLVYDTQKQIKVIVTGSSSLEIAATGRHMTGRMLYFMLYQFGFSEFLKTRDNRLHEIYLENNRKILELLLKDRRPEFENGCDLFRDEFITRFEEYSVFGGYPAVVLADTDDIRAKILEDIFNGYIMKDVKGLLELATDRNLLLLAKLLATQTGNIVVYKNLGQAASLDSRNLKKHLSLLEQTFIVREVKPFFRNRQSELCKNPKYYFIDQGFRNCLLGNFSTPDQRTDAGVLVENTVFTRLNNLLGSMERLNFWRTKAGAEVDFVISRGEKIIPVEVKYSDFKSPQITRSLSSFIDTFSPGIACVLTKNFIGSMKRNGTAVFFFPVYYL
ncbi:MAG: ATP-binding protein [Candidatus Wallbacteria bacterium]|nr:ATP-binding protein [Candidatus Wallbacteria bacterium]